MRHRQNRNTEKESRKKVRPKASSSEKESLEKEEECSKLTYAGSGVLLVRSCCHRMQSSVISGKPVRVSGSSDGLTKQMISSVTEIW
ncbi:hypothetical protein K1719_044283 [Acacia pycnantha]|nr:hypothetical protein K1719_044283 [Acacia pycnantha]